VNRDVEDEDILLLVRGVNLCMSNFINALIVLPKHERNTIIGDNIVKIVESAKSIHNHLHSKINDRKIDYLSILCSKLEEIWKKY